MFNLKNTILFVIAILFSINLSAQYSPDTYIVILEPGTTQAEIDLALFELNSTEVFVTPITETRLWKVNGFPFVYPPSSTNIIDINGLIPELGTRPEVNTGGLNYEAYTGDDSSGGSSTPVPKDYQLDCYGKLSTHVANGTSPVDIGFFDTGLDYEGNIHPEYFFDLDGFDQNNHLNNKRTAYDDNGHGTHMASISSHIINKAFGTQLGTKLSNPNEYYDIRKAFDEEGSGYIAEIIQALEEATLKGMKIANCSWSFKTTFEEAYRSPLYKSLKALEIYGVLIIASAGNESVDLDLPQNKYWSFFPAAYELPNILTATTYDCTDDIAEYANFGAKSIDIALPGLMIPGLTPAGKLGHFSGTSQSTAILTGIVTNLATHQTQFDYESIICAIMLSANSKLNLQSKVKSGGVINARRALDILGSCSTTGGSGGGNRREGITLRDREAILLSSIYPNPTSQFFNLD